VTDSSCCWRVCDRFILRASCTKLISGHFRAPAQARCVHLFYRTGGRARVAASRHCPLAGRLEPLAAAAAADFLPASKCVCVWRTRSSDCESGRPQSAPVAVCWLLRKGAHGAARFMIGPAMTADEELASCWQTRTHTSHSTADRCRPPGRPPLAYSQAPPKVGPALWRMNCAEAAHSIGASALFLSNSATLGRALTSQPARRLGGESGAT
jgi:hypothetical protein